MEDIEFTMYKIKLSPYHKIFYNEWKIHPFTNYDIVFDQLLSNNLDIIRLTDALHRFIYNHLLLNSHVVEMDDDLYWVKNKLIYPLEVIEKDATNKLIKEYINISINLNMGPLYRFAIFRQYDCYRLILIFSHILIDGNSFKNIISEISNYYNDPKHCISLNLTSQAKLIDETTKHAYAQLEKNFNSDKNFWDNCLTDMESVNLNFISTSYAKTATQPQVKDISYIKAIRFDFNEEITQKLDHIHKKLNLSPYAFGQIVFAILLHKYTYQDTFGITYPITIVRKTGIICGSTINTNIAPYRFQPTSTILDLIINYKIFVRNSYRHKTLSINDILVGKDKNLLDVYFAQVDLQDTPFRFDGVSVIKISEEFYVCFGVKLDFEQEYKNQLLKYRVRYNQLDIDENILRQFIIHYKKLFIQIIYDLEKGENKPVAAYSLIDENEYYNIIYKLNYIKSLTLADTTKPIHKIFEEQALNYPDQIAITHGELKLTYKELNQKSNQLANHLIMTYEDIAPDSLIIIFLNRGIFTIISILAILKCGAAYVPIDSKYPEKRIKYILEDTKAKIIITHEVYKEKIFFLCNSTTISNPYILLIDNIDLQLQLNNQSVNAPDIIVTANNLAYVIYTSGTSGKPKGVLQQHDSVINLFKAANIYFKFDNNDVWSLFHSYVFDFAVWEIWGALLHGGKLVILSDEQIRNLNLFYDICLKEEITIINQTPSVFYQFAEIALNQPNSKKLINLRYVIFGGEALNFAQLEKWVKYYGVIQPQLINMYGITETTVHNTYKLITQDDITRSLSVIGKPLPNKQIYILDRNLKLAPIGAIGEMYVGGHGIARGYLNQPELTNTKFIDITSINQNYHFENKLLYATGDLARLLPNGDLIYVGRNDEQVKIRGYRIEIQEIENAIRSYPGVRDAIVSIKNLSTPVFESENQYLVGYYCAYKSFNENDFMDYLASILPQYMLPNVLVHISKVPITINGKVDKTSLPCPVLIQPNYSEPRTKAETLICNAFSSVLGQKKIGIDDNFFHLGGNSILAIKLTTLLQHNFEINISQIFILKTPRRIAEVAVYIKNNLYNKLNNVSKFIESISAIKKRNLVNKEKYLNLYHIQKPIFVSNLKPIYSVLLSGATGHLGCNILYQLLHKTTHNIYILVRANSNEQAYERINQKFSYYFNVPLMTFNKRIVVLASHLEQKFLGLNPDWYKNLVDNIDSIIHSAALVKHYSHHEEFQKANVESTINLLELAKSTKFKDFHYISTIGIFVDGYIPNRDYYIFDENCNNELLQNKNNLYVKTKYEGELLTIQYRNYGLTTNIYRVGNLAMHSQNYKNQENIEENAFFIKIKTILKLGIIPKELSEIEVSPVDCVALGIVKLFNQQQLSNQTYHLFNPNLANLYELLIKFNGIHIKLVSFNEFIDALLLRLRYNSDIELIELFMLHQRWLEYIDLRHFTVIEILQDKTSLILSSLGFKWPHITANMLDSIIKNI